MIGPAPKSFHDYHPRRRRTHPRYDGYWVPKCLYLSLNRESVAYAEKIRQINEHVETLPQRARRNFIVAIVNGNATLPERVVH